MTVFEVLNCGPAATTLGEVPTKMASDLKRSDSSLSQCSTAVVSGFVKFATGDDVTVAKVTEGQGRVVQLVVATQLLLDWKVRRKGLG